MGSVSVCVTPDDTSDKLTLPGNITPPKIVKSLLV